MPAQAFLQSDSAQAEGSSNPPLVLFDVQPQEDLPAGQSPEAPAMQSAAASPDDASDVAMEPIPAQDSSAARSEEAPTVVPYPLASPLVAQPFPPLDQNNCQVFNAQIQEVIIHGLAGFPTGSSSDTRTPHQFFNMPIARGSAYHTFAVSVVILFTFHN